MGNNHLLQQSIGQHYERKPILITFTQAIP
jgi:hypothetical protein